jgi:hypothetical protein
MRAKRVLLLCASALFLPLMSISKLSILLRVLAYSASGFYIPVILFFIQ